MRGPRKLCQRGSNSENVVFFCFLGGSMYHYKQTIIGLPAKWYFAGVTMTAQHWIWLGSFMIFQGSGPVLQRNPIFLWFFRGRGPGPPVSPSGSAHGGSLDIFLHQWRIVIALIKILIFATKYWFNQNVLIWLKSCWVGRKTSTQADREIFKLVKLPISFYNFRCRCSNTHTFQTCCDGDTPISWDWIQNHTPRND